MVFVPVAGFFVRMIRSLPQPFAFLQIHIEAARNSTDDFNLFHDKNKWQRIAGNPFGGPIALAFQLECLIEYQVKLYRQHIHEENVINTHRLRYSNYQFTFANVVRPNEPVSVDIRKSQLKYGKNVTLGNRVVLKVQRGAALIGHKIESQQPLCLADTALSGLPDLATIPDRSYIPHQPFFLKRKYLNVGNAKNFLSGSLAEQADYFDEWDEKIVFPEIFPVALMSCALLERALKEHHDFESEPMVYTSHNISIDRDRLSQLKSNDALNLLVKQPEKLSLSRGLGKVSVAQDNYRCFGLVKDGTILFRAEISLTPLEEILKVSRGNVRR